MTTTSVRSNLANINHPERQPGEVFLGNYTFDEFFGFVGWKSKRLGLRALQTTGEPASSQLSPAFVQETELLAAGFLVQDGVIINPAKTSALSA